MKPLHNRVEGKVLKQILRLEPEKRVTISFYRYLNLKNPDFFRNHLYYNFEKLHVLGRIYVASEGVNGQISVPERNFEAFKEFMFGIAMFENLRLNIAIDDDGKSFFKLIVRLKKKIVADGIDDPDFDVTNCGVHLNAKDFNEVTSREDVVIVDMRNHYESEVGHFENAILPDVDTFREQLPLVAEMLQDKKDKPVVMYCTGGIRCEKASAYLKFKGFKEVYQLNGGIIEYARQIKQLGLPNKFHGKNFVFDERLGERVSNEIIAHCHQCGSLCDHHTNCANEGCNLLFIQCENCRQIMENCCSSECKDIIHLSEEEQRSLRKGKNLGRLVFKKGRFPKVNKKENTSASV